MKWLPLFGNHSSDQICKRKETNSRINCRLKWNLVFRKIFTKKVQQLIELLFWIKSELYFVFITLWIEIKSKLNSNDFKIDLKLNFIRNVSKMITNSFQSTIYFKISFLSFADLIQWVIPKRVAVISQSNYKLIKIINNTYLKRCPNHWLSPNVRQLNWNKVLISVELTLT